MGHRCHVLQTASVTLANYLFEQALELFIEPNFERTESGFVVEFIGTDADRDTAIAMATAKYLVGVAQ